MKRLLGKEFTLFASLLTYCFLAFGLMAMIPGYPILLGAFFVSFGIFQSFQTVGETNDILYSALLPVSKKDVVKSKYLFTVCVETAGFALMAILTLVRMLFLDDFEPYVQNAMMNANLIYLGFALVIFGCFNLCFLRGFFRTAYRYGKPFLIFCIVTFLVIGVAETLHHLPGLSWMNILGFDRLGAQIAFLAGGGAVFAGMTLFSLRASIADFERIDL